MSISYVNSGAGRVALEVAGHGPLVICSPGMGDFRDAFAPLAAHLRSSGFRVACVDLRGHGDSTADFDSYGDDAIATDLLSVIDALGGGPAILAGASISAAATVIAAGRRPDLITGLVLIGPYLRNGGSKLMRQVLHVALTRPWGPSVWRMYAAKLWPGLGKGAGERAARSKASLTRPGRWPAFHATSAVDHDVVTPWLGRVQIPVLVVMGDADPDWPDPAAEAAWVASNFRDAGIVMIHGAGHAPMLERPEDVNPAVSTFLGRFRTDDAPVPAGA